MKTNKFVPSAVLVASAVSAALGGSLARAADAGLEDIVVTAERRTQNLQDVPVSATVLTGEELARRGIENLNDIQQVAPSIAINNYNRSVFVNIRGVGIAQSAPTSSPGVAYYIDGQLIPHEQFIGHAFYDIAAVEVLRGPQGTLSGQNSTGGAIYVRSPAPKYDDYSGGIDQTFSNYGGTRTVGTANLGFTSNIALRVAAIHDERDSFTKNLGTSGSTPGDARLDGARLNLALRSNNDGVTGNLRVDYFKFRSGNLAVKNRADTVTSNPFQIEEDARSFLNQTGHRLSGEMHIALTDDMEIRALSSWQNGYTHDQTDGDRTATSPPQPPAANVGRVSYASTDFQTWIHEVDLLSKGNGPLQWVVGGFLLDEMVPVSLLRDNLHTTDFVTSNSTIITKAKNSSDSVFGQFTYRIDSLWDIIAGARHSDDRQLYNRIALPGAPLPAGTDRIGPPAASTATTGKIGANFHLTDTDMLYVTASKGYKAGGVNLTLGTPNFSPEHNTVYEAGIKSTMLDNRLRVNADVFDSKYKDIQLSSLLNGLPITQNAASGTSWGAELEMTGRFGGFGFNAGAGFLDARFARDAVIVNTLTNLPQTVHKHDKLPFSPDLTLNASVDYAFIVPGGTLTPRLQWSRIGSQLATPFVNVATIVPGHQTEDARLTYAADRNWLIEGYVSNLTDSTYIAAQLQNSSSATGGILYGAPRQYGVRFAINFGK